MMPGCTELEVAEENEAAPPVADILLEVGTNEELEVAEALVEFGAAVADVEEEVVEDADGVRFIEVREGCPPNVVRGSNR